MSAALTERIASMVGVELKRRGHEPTPRHGRPHRGPCVVLSLDECRAVRGALLLAHGFTDEAGHAHIAEPEIEAMLAKIDAAIAADPSFRAPLK